MPNKSKFRKNRKLKSKMKGGNAIGPGKEAQVAPEDAAVPVAKATLVREQSGSAKSDYGALNMKYFIFAISAVGLMGIAWLFLTRSMIRHEYSEALSYSLVALAIFFSFFMVMFAGLKSMSVGGGGIMDGFKYIFKVVLYCITSCLPAILITTQLGFLIYICYKHADFLYSSTNIPALFSTFNKLAAVMVLGQSFVWYKQVSKIVLGNKESSNPALVPGFILASIISGIAISQMFIILEYLKTDC